MKYIPIAVATIWLFRPSWSFVSHYRLRNDFPTNTISWHDVIPQEQRKGIQHQAQHRDITLLSSLNALPSIQAIALSCLLPTCLGYIRYEYGVSYGYGSSVAFAAALMLRQLSYGSLAYWHALALIFYGIRLNIFLLYRELYVPRFRVVRERIEERRTAATKYETNLKTRFLARTPFVVGCALLYVCLVAPLIVTSQAISSDILMVNICIVWTWFGFALAALGDLQKSFIKATLGEHVLVKGALFSRLRHPNYTGEALAWTSSFLASVIVAANNWKQSLILPLLAATFGWIGIIGVLAMAGAGLEKKQFQKYSDTAAYQQWIKNSWAGPTWERK
jgi:steroid 5-alpha reductase family enzyme